MSEDPLEQLKREMEEERTGRPYVQPLPTARFELDRQNVRRGENLTGVVVIAAGRNQLWVDRLELFVYGVARSTGSLHTSTSHHITCNASVSAGESRQFPVWVPIPPDTPLGEKLLMLKGAPAVAMQHFMVEPEPHYTELAHAFARAAGMELVTWNVGGNGEGVVACLQPKEDGCPVHGRVGLEMCLQGEVLLGSLTVEAPNRTVVGVLRALVRPKRRRIPFSLRINDENAAEKLLALLQAHNRQDLLLPIPAPGDRDTSTDNLPVPSGEPPR